MGAKWGAVHFRTEDRAAVLRRVEQRVSGGGRALVGPALGGWVSVYPDEPGSGPAKNLAPRGSGVALYLSLFEDVVSYELLDNGKIVDSYASIPDYFGPVAPAVARALAGKPEVLAARVGVAVDAITQAMRQPPRGSGIEAAFPGVIAFRALAAALGLQNAEASYGYLEHGEPEEIEGRDSFTHLPDRQVLETARAQVRHQKEDIWQARVAAGDLAGSVSLGASWPGLSGTPPGEGGFRVSLVLHASDRKGHPLPPTQTCQIWREPWTALAPDLSADAKEVALASSPCGRYVVATATPSELFAKTLVFRDTAGGRELWRGKTEAITVVSVATDDERLHVVTRGRRSLTLLTLSIGDGKLIERRLPEGKSATVNPAGTHAAIIEPRGQTVTFLDLGGAAPVELGRRTLPSPSLPPAASLSVPPGMATVYARQLEAVAPGERGVRLEQILASFPDDLRPAGRVGNTQADVDRALEELRSKLAASYIEPAPSYGRLGWSASGDRLFVASTAGMQVHPWPALLAAGSGDFPPAESHLPLPFEDHHHVPGAGLAHVHAFWHDPGRDRLFCGGDGGQIGFIDLATRRARLLPPLPEPVSLVDLIASTDGRALAAICRAGSRDETENRLVVWRLPDLHARCDAL